MTTVHTQFPPRIGPSGPFFLVTLMVKAITSLISSPSRYPRSRGDRFYQDLSKRRTKITVTVQLSPSLPPAIPNAQLQSLLGGAGGRMDQQQLMELLGGAGGFPHALANMGRGGGASDTPRYAGNCHKTF